MIQLKQEDVIHKAMMLRILMEIADHQLLSHELYFKGGSSCMMLGWLDRFSIDLDFDLKRSVKGKSIRKEIHQIIKRCGFTINQEAKNTLFFVLKYEAPAGRRNTLKLSIVENPPKTNMYAVEYFAEINRYLQCQTRETMFANKLVAVIDRYKTYKTVAGRDLYDIHYFFRNGFDYNEKVIKERTKLEAHSYFRKLILFIEKKITMTIIDQDLNYLLPAKQYTAVRKTLKQEVIMYLREEVKRA